MITYKLVKPIKRESGETLSELSYREDSEMCLGDLLWIKASQQHPNDTDYAATSIQRKCGLSRGEVCQLGLADYVALCALEAPKPAPKSCPHCQAQIEPEQS